MNNRIKIGNVYFDLPEGALGRPAQVVAEKLESPDMLEPVAFMSSEPDLISQYLAGPVTRKQIESTGKAPAVELDRMTEWQAFTGAKSTHPQQWLNYVEGRTRHCGFNNWAFLFGLQWFIFNGMYWKAVIAAAFEVSIALIAFKCANDFQTFPEFSRFGLPLALLVLSIGLVIPRIIIGYLANIALLRRAMREIKNIKTFKLDNERMLAMIASSGSGKIAPVAVLYVAIFIIRFIVANH